MTNLQYPLDYEELNLKIVDDNEAILAKIRNVFDTFLNERTLNPQIGLDVTVLFGSLPIKELLTYQIETQLDLIENINYNMYINNITDNKFEIVLKVTFNDGNDTFLNIPIET